MFLKQTSILFYMTPTFFINIQEPLNIKTIIDKVKDIHYNKLPLAGFPINDKYKKYLSLKCSQKGLSI